MAVAIEQLEQQRSGFLMTQLRKASSRRKKEQLQKFFGKCGMPDGSVTILVAKASNETEASRKLHKGYKIAVVLDILTEAEMPKEWAKIKPSLIQRSQLM